MAPFVFLSSMILSRFCNWLVHRGAVPKQVLFHRDYLRFQGGHLKVWNYFQHIQSSADFRSDIFFTEQSQWDLSNPWHAYPRLSSWQPEEADILFLAGLDWQAVLSHHPYQQNRLNIPVVNLIQGLSHANPADVKYPFLREPAIRICVSDEVAQAIEDTGVVNGPIFTIPNGIDLSSLPAPLSCQERDIPVLLVAIKKPELGRQLQALLDDDGVVLLDSSVPRPQFLDRLSRAKVAVFLPHWQEGFYLPALEGMALRTLVVCPDCIGNRSFCLDGLNCFRPDYHLPALVAAIRQAQGVFEQELAIKFLDEGRRMAAGHGLMQERAQFLAIMQQLDNLWWDLCKDNQILS